VDCGGKIEPVQRLEGYAVEYLRRCLFAALSS
jgi:hypothetical protein